MGVCGLKRQLYTTINTCPYQGDTQAPWERGEQVGVVTVYFNFLLYCNNMLVYSI